MFNQLSSGAREELIQLGIIGKASASQIAPIPPVQSIPEEQRNPSPLHRESLTDNHQILQGATSTEQSSQSAGPPPTHVPQPDNHQILPGATSTEQSTQSAGPPPTHVPQFEHVGFDAHFHPDRLHSIMVKSGNPLREDPIIPCKVVGGVLNLCDPATYMGPEFEQVLQGASSPSWKLAVGIHPKHASRYNEREWQAMIRHLTHSRVVGISEVGLDYSVSSRKWGKQRALFHRIPSLGTLGHVLIMHLRGEASDPRGWVVHNYALDLLKRKCVPTQRVHLHCFCGDEEQVRAWTHAFPNAYFGLSGLLSPSRSSETTVRAVRAIPSGRLLLETDSPHLCVTPRGTYNTPAYLADVGQMAAQVRGCSLRDLLALTHINALRLYGP